jgi:16S rRNA (adenine1518-N6/adenine1519-N6)-dimethyltransferase
MKRTRRHALGQHFLVNRSVLDKIVRTIAPEASDVIVEIGPGKGGLTFLLAERAGRVIAIEKDPAFIPLLREKAGPNLSVVEADILKTDFVSLLEDAGGAFGRAKLVGNLPYSVSSPILFMALAAHAIFAKCVFLIQKEVAERVCGRPGTKDHAPISILLQNRFEARIEFRVSPGSFSPPPKVDSALLSLTRRETSLFRFDDEDRFRAFLRAAFAHRRKLLAKNLEMSGLPRARIEAAYGALGLARNARAEELPANRLVTLYRALYESPDSAVPTS